MSTVSPEKLYKPEDLLSLENGARCELVDGRLVEKTMGAESSWIALNLATVINTYVRSHRLGRVLGADGSYQIFADDPNRVRIPDVSFISRDRLPDGRLPRGHLKVRPDLIVEVVSPNDGSELVSEKVEEYLQAEVPLIWVVQPLPRIVDVFRVDRTVTRLRESDSLSGEDAIPGLTIPVAELFSDSD